MNINVVHIIAVMKVKGYHIDGIRSEMSVQVASVIGRSLHQIWPICNVVICLRLGPQESYGGELLEAQAGSDSLNVR